jgi:serine/threonine protein kinase
MIGKDLAHYRIIEKLGAGGMGEVYVAEDTKLGRQVALKVLPPEMATSERLMRFEREAKAVAALDHPNIVHAYFVEESESFHFITMELVKGKTVSLIIPKKVCPLSKLRFLAGAEPILLTELGGPARHNGQSAVKAAQWAPLPGRPPGQSP